VQGWVFHAGHGDVSISYGVFTAYTLKMLLEQEDRVAVSISYGVFTAYTPELGVATGVRRNLFQSPTEYLQLIPYWQFPGSSNYCCFNLLRSIYSLYPSPRVPATPRSPCFNLLRSIYSLYRMPTRWASTTPSFQSPTEYLQLIPWGVCGG